MTQLEKEIINDYVNTDMIMKDIQEKYNIGYKKLRSILDKNNIPHGRGIKTKNKPNPKNRRILTLEEEKECKTIYENGGTVADCQKALHASQSVIQRCLKKYGIYKTHSESIGQTPQNQRKYLVNDAFFDTESPEMAYVLGFIAADGSVRKDANEVKIGLCEEDAELLFKFKDLIGGRPIKFYTTQKGYRTASWELTSKHIKEKLSEYNIVPNKTFVFSFPKNLNKNYWVDFIRGYFDGDGSVSTAGADAIRWQLCSATTDVLQTVVDFFYEEYDIPKVNIQVAQRKNPLYYIQYSTSSTRKIFNFLYSKNCLCLKRKFDKFEQLIK